MLAFKYGTVNCNIVPAIMSQNTYNYSAYACVNGKTTFVTLINKDAVNLTVNLQLSNVTSTMQVYRLTAPSITSAQGVTFAGASLKPDGSFTHGSVEQYNFSQKNVLVNIPAGSAAVVALQ